MSFRRYGGVNYNARNNIVKSNYNTAANLSVTGNVGQDNSYITFLSDISGDIIIYGNVDISGNLDVSESITCTSLTQTSDYRIKHDVKNLDETFTINGLRPVLYKNIKLNKLDIGLIAHELQEVYPYLVSGVKDGENLQTVNYTGLIPILIKEIQDLKNNEKILKKDIDDLKNIINNDNRYLK